MKLEENLDLRTKPQILPSDYLSEISGLNVSSLDYSRMPTGTHKWPKGKRIVEETKNKGYRAILFMNPVLDPRKDANGSGIDTLELVCALSYPKAQVISVVHDGRALWRELIHSDFPDSRQRINLGLDLNKFYSAERLENHFKNLMQSNEGDEKVRDARDFLYSKIDPLKCVDGTNLGDIGEYGLDENLIEELKEFDYVVSSAGIGGRALNQIISLQNGKPIHIIVIPNGHPLDPFHRYEISTSPRVQTKFRGRVHEILKKESVGRDDVIFKSIGLFGGEQAKKLFVDEAIKADNLNMRTSADGAIGFAVLRDRNNPEHKENFTKEGLKIFNTHIASEGGFNYIYQNLIPFGSKVCVVNTGISNYSLLKQLIAEGKVK